MRRIDYITFLVWYIFAYSVFPLALHYHKGKKKDRIRDTICHLEEYIGKKDASIFFKGKIFKSNIQKIEALQ